MLRLTGKVDVSQRLTDLKAGQKYALYVGVDNRSTGDASVTVTSGGKVLAANSTGKSIAKNYIKAYGHNTNSNTENGSSYFQNMYVFFTAPENGDATVTLSHKSTDGAHTYFDDVRIVENQYSGITYEKDGTLKSLTNGFENTPRASGRSWSPVPKALRTTASTSPSCMLRSRRPVGMSRRWTMCSMALGL